MTACEKRGQTGMKGEESLSQSTAEESKIRSLIERWSKAVRDQDLAAIRQDHDAEILMFDVPLPFQSRGIDDYMATWETFFASAEKPVSFNFTDVEITAGSDVAFATAVGHCLNSGKTRRHLHSYPTLRSSDRTLAAIFLGPPPAAAGTA